MSQSSQAERGTRPPTCRPATLFAALLILLTATASSLQAQQGRSGAADSVTDSTATLMGKVMSALTGGPLPNARVVLVQSGYGAFTDSTGAFRVPNVPAGLDTVQVSLIGFAKAQTPLRLKAGTTTTATFLLSQTVLRVEEIHVEVKRKPGLGKLSRFEEHKAEGLGFYITPQMIEKRHPQHSSDLLRMVPGLTVGPYNMGQAPYRISRSAMNCTPPLFLDGVLNRGMVIDDIDRDDIMAIEVYRGPSETPPQYETGANDCGALVVWTQSGGVSDSTSGG